ncbi:MAG: HNH endonuclease signature motif containing protein, partial [Chloroflexota bacterium]|nr:HNH endonuclease signature motif containing protein [Chloroflexota bacterium]
MSPISGDFTQLSIGHRKLNRKRWGVVRRLVLIRDGYKCRSCGRMGRLEVDHVRPLNKGGDAWDLGNLQTLCRGCHIAKTRRENERPPRSWPSPRAAGAPNSWPVRMTSCNMQ